MNAKQIVTQLFAQWEQGDSAPFFAALAADLVWTAKGTTPISGTYRGKQAYLDQCYKPLLAVFAGPTGCKVHRIIGDGELVVVEWHGETPTVAGPLYAQDYCWVLRVAPGTGEITEVTGYYDTARVEALLAPAGAGSG
jgi:ketosteroid isomerase-like protein